MGTWGQNPLGWPFSVGGQLDLLTKSRKAMRVWNPWLYSDHSMPRKVRSQKSSRLDRAGQSQTHHTSFQPFALKKRAGLWAVQLGQGLCLREHIAKSFFETFELGLPLISQNFHPSLKTILITWKSEIWLKQMTCTNVSMMNCSKHNISHSTIFKRIIYSIAMHYRKLLHIAALHHGMVELSCAPLHEETRRALWHVLWTSTDAQASCHSQSARLKPKIARTSTETTTSTNNKASCEEMKF